MNVTTVSVLICTYNRARLLRESLIALQAQQEPRDCAIEIIVVDNNSTDNTQAVVAEAAAEGPHRIVSLRESAQGKSFALNTGLAHATGDVLALTDDDVVPASNWLARIVEHFRTRDVVFVFGKVLPRWGRTPPPELLTPDAQGIWGPLAIVDYGDTPTDYLPDSRMQRLPVGANLAFSRAVLVAIGGWRTDLGKVNNTLVSGEDHEIFMRLRRFNMYRGYYDPQASVQHFVPASRLTREYFRRWFFWHGKTNALMLDDLYPELDFAKVPRLFGAPRFAFRQATHQLWRYLRSRGSADAVHALTQELYVIEYAGLFEQCWTMWRRNRGSAAASTTASNTGAAARALVLVALLGITGLPSTAAPRVQLTIHDGRVWLVTARATAAEILAEWARVGQLQIVSPERAGTEPLTLDISGMSEAAALDLVLRSAGGYVAVDRAPGNWTAATSRYARVVIAARGPQSNNDAGVSTTVAAPATEPVAAPLPATSGELPSVAATAPDSVETAPGVRRLIGADGLAVPDDQDGAPPPSGQRGRSGRY